MEPFTALAIEGIKLFGPLGLLLIVVLWLAATIKERLFDNKVRTDIIKILHEQLNSFQLQMAEKDKQVEEFAAARNNAVAELRKWEYVVAELQVEVSNLRAQLMESEKSNESLRHYIYSVMKEIHALSKTDPDAVSKMNLPEIPERG